MYDYMYNYKEKKCSAIANTGSEDIDFYIFS